MTHKLKARFYRLVVMEGLEEQAFVQVDWANLLRQYGERTPSDRLHRLDDVQYLFEPRPTGSRHLAVHKLKDAGEYLSRVAQDLSSVSEVMAVTEDGTFADTSCVVFQTWGNIFGIVAANSSAPRAGRVAEWITAIEPFGPERVVVARPLIVPADKDWRELSDGASKVSVRIPIEMLDELGAHLGGAATSFADEIPNSEVTLTISYGRRTPGVSEGGGLLRVARWFADRLAGNPSRRASASVFREVKSMDSKKKAKRRLERELVDLVEHEICHVFELASQQGEVKIDATLNAIEYGASQNAGQLRKAWEAGYDNQGEMG